MKLNRSNDESAAGIPMRYDAASQEIEFAGLTRAKLLDARAAADREIAEKYGAHIEAAMAWAKSVPLNEHAPLETTLFD